MNSVLESYIRGKNESLQEAQVADEKKRREAQIKLEQDKLAQDKEQFDAQMKMAQESANFAHAKARQEIADKYLETGVTPAGAKEVSTAPVMGEMEAPDYTTVNIPGIGEINLANREKAAQRNADIARISGAPKAEFEQEKLNLQQQNKLALEEAQAKNAKVLEAQKAESSSTLAFGIQKAREKADFDRDRAKAKDEYSLQQLKNQGSENVARINAAQREAAAGTLKLTADQKNKIDVLTDLETDLARVKGLLEQDKYSYFSGLSPSGISAELSSLKGESNPLWAQIQTELSHIFEKYGTGEGGKNFTPSEQNLIKTHVPRPDHTITPTQAREDIEFLIKKLPEIKNSTYLSALPVKASDVKPEGGNSPRVIKFDAQGNVVK